jgi:hypothetical protein
MPPEPPRPPVTRGAPPPSVLTAVRLMFIRAALSVISVVVAVTSKDAIKKAVIQSDSTLTPAQVNTAVNIGIGVAVVFGIGFLVLYTILALQLGKGKNWARVVALIFAILGILGGLISVARPQPTLNRVVALVIALVDVGIFVTLVQRRTREFFVGV